MTSRRRASASRRQAFALSSIKPASSLSWSLYIKASRPGLRTLLAKDGVIYKEAMAIVAEDVKKIMAEEFLFYQVYMKANEERIIEKEKESPLLRGPNLAPKQCPLTLLQSSLISVWRRHMPMRASCAVPHMCACTGMCVYERWRGL